MHQTLVSLNNALAEDAERQLAMFLATTDSPEAIQAFMEALTSQYGSAAASAAASYYDDTRLAAEVPGQYQASVAQPVSSQIVDASTRWAIYGPGDNLAGKLTGVAQRLILSPGRDTILRSTHEDPAKPRWARVPDGKACGFCRMLASRGAVYRAKQTADFHAHDHCGCHPEVLFKDAKPSYDVDALRAQYREAVAQVGSSDPQAISNIMDGLT